jgi:hypothetical protein
MAIAMLNTLQHAGKAHYERHLFNVGRPLVAGVRNLTAITGDPAEMPGQ